MKKVFICFILALAFVFPIAAAGQQTVYDDAELLTAGEAERVKDLYDSIYEDSGLLCVFVTGYNLGDIEAALSSYADGAADMVLLAVDMQSRHFDLYQYNGVSGESAFQISASESDRILDAVFDDMVDADYASAAFTFGSLSESYFNNEHGFVPGSGGEDYHYTSYGDPREWTFRNYVSALTMPFIIGMAIGGISVAVVKGSYKKKTRGNAYPLDEYSTLNLTACEDRFVNKTVSVARIPDSSSSGGGRSGGGHSGGGGAHMGGRSF